jgi:hypothetical protein
LIQSNFDIFLSLLVCSLLTSFLSSIVTPLGFCSPCSFLISSLLFSILVYCLLSAFLFRNFTSHLTSSLSLLYFCHPLLTLFLPSSPHFISAILSSLHFCHPLLAPLLPSSHYTTLLSPETLASFSFSESPHEDRTFSHFFSTVISNDKVSVK